MSEGIGITPFEALYRRTPPLYNELILDTKVALGAVK